MDKTRDMQAGDRKIRLKQRTNSLFLLEQIESLADPHCKMPRKRLRKIRKLAESIRR